MQAELEANGDEAEPNEVMVSLVFLYLWILFLASTQP